MPQARKGVWGKGRQPLSRLSSQSRGREQRSKSGLTGLINTAASDSANPDHPPHKPTSWAFANNEGYSEQL